LKISYEIEGEPLGTQFFVLVRLIFVIVCCIYGIHRIIKLASRREATLPKPSFKDTSFGAALDLRELSPANRDNITINLN